MNVPVAAENVAPGRSPLDSPASSSIVRERLWRLYQRGEIAAPDPVANVSELLTEMVKAAATGVS